ncbi:MarR family transcriptional regulator [Clavibacter sepedonicus]|uniref:MarR family transcriptional regulator n=1 Tax=Clavibacter TaxID=1573 RepID=UPI000312D547|nr:MULTISPECIES: MarR family transcriptional regulator [Clavibacter]MBD5382973.1 MarR family transcriptional regulator [Clavibacter sp.]OQJ48499.1 MarR family transcriptional regulator [Clavibacter sepedonicus]OQJ53980.1 MarR family transcriptional regulator [Clavibacter sepedonicus]UUK65509.1 MarR family transcriptional regulator [Clavibacter sepedonicus]
MPRARPRPEPGTLDALPAPGTGVPAEADGAGELGRILRDVLGLAAGFERRLGGVLDVNPTDMKAMEHLIQAGSLSPTELAGRLGISTAAATLVVDRLVEVGHVDRRPHPHDRRRVVVVPRPASVGRAMAELMPMIGGVARAADALTDAERAAVTRFLGEVREVYREAAAGPAGSGAAAEPPDGR